MKKLNYITILLFHLFLFSGQQNMYSQTAGVGDMVTTPIASPSMAAMSKYSDVSVSLSTGLPEIGLTLLSAPTNGANYPLSLSYNVRSVTDNDTASDVGNGWSFFGAGIIYKKIINYLDECYDNSTRTGYKRNEFDDVYYYDLPGLSGKFRIKRDTINNTFSLINLTPNHVKISYTRNSNTDTFKADDFTITADNGYQYIFNITDTARYDCGDFWLGKEFKGAYYLTKVLNPIGVEVASIAYEQRTKYKGSNNNYLIFLQNKLKTITSRNGQVVFDYTYDDTLENNDNYDPGISDPYSLQKITLKNPAGENLYTYSFNYTMLSKGSKSYQKRRILNSVTKNDKNGVLIEKNSFIYASSNGEGVLKRVISPTGGVTEYNFEQGETYFNYNDPAYLASLAASSTIINPDIQYWSVMSSGNITTDQALVYNFSVPGDASVKKNFQFILDITDFQYPDPSDDPLHPTPAYSLKFTLKRGNEVIIPTVSMTDYYYHAFNLYNYPGNYTLEFISEGGAKGGGTFGASEIKLYPGPFRNALASGYNRIKNIKYYKNANDANAFRTVNYGYDSFELSNSASGYYFDNEKDSNDEPTTTYILYKSVKEYETGKGSVRYSFKTPDDYPKQQTGGTTLEPQYFWPYYNVTKGGLLSKKEVYDEQNTLLSAELYDYELDKFSDEDYSFQGTYKITSKPAYIKKSFITNRAYFPNNGILESSSETWVSPSNLKPYYIKSTADGDISEQFLTYATGQTGYSHLETAYMTGIPIIKEEKKNGKTLSKTITKYDAPSLLPISVLATSLSGNTKQTMKIDNYDDRGNPVQISLPTGSPVTFIYGYNKTQVIAKIEGAKYNDIQTNQAVTAAITASDNDNLTPTTESTLITALDNLRINSAMTGYTITTYTYDPLLGLTTMTSPDGQREIYEYDSAGRLKTVKKMEKNTAGNTVYKIVKEYQYNYKQ